MDVGCQLRVVAYVTGTDGRNTASVSALSGLIAPQITSPDASTPDTETSSQVLSRKHLTINIEDAPNSAPVNEKMKGDSSPVLAVNSPTGAEHALQALDIKGKPQCGVKLLAKGKAHNKAVKCRFQWTRLFLDKSGVVVKTRLKAVNTPWYTPTAEDIGCWLRVKAAPVLKTGELGRATVATTATAVAASLPEVLEEETPLEMQFEENSMIMHPEVCTHAF